METAEILDRVNTDCGSSGFDVSQILLSLGGLVSVTQMPSVWQIQPHQTVVRSHNSLIDLKICWASTQRLHVDAPFLRIKFECLKRPGLASQFNCVNELIAAVISSTRIPLGVFVGHRRAQSVEDRAGCEVFGSDEND